MIIYADRTSLKIHNYIFISAVLDTDPSRTIAREINKAEETTYMFVVDSRNIPLSITTFPA